MQLEKFIEEDIVEFLNEQVNHQTGPEEERQPASYEERRESQINQLKEQKEFKDKVFKELRSGLKRLDILLERNDLVAAIYLYKHLKDLFREIPPKYRNERKKLYDQLITSYYMIKKASSREDWEEAMSKEDENVDSSTAADEQESSPKETGDTTVHTKKNPETTNAETPIAGGDSNKENILEQLEKVKELIQKKKAREANEEYEILKEEFRKLEDEEAEREILKDMLSIRKSLKELEEHEVNRKTRAPPKEVIQKEEDDKTNKDIQKIYKYIDNDEIKSALIKYKEVKKAYEENPDDNLKKDLKDIKERIMEKRKQKLRGKDTEIKEGECWDNIKEIKDLADKDLARAKDLFIEVQHKASKLPKEDRLEIYKALDSVKSRLHLAHSAQNMKRVEG